MRSTAAERRAIIAWARRVSEGGDISVGIVDAGYRVGRWFTARTHCGGVGPESSGKTTLALHAMAEISWRHGGRRSTPSTAFDPEYSQRLGLNVDDVIVCQPETGEMALEVVDTLVSIVGV